MIPTEALKPIVAYPETFAGWWVITSAALLINSGSMVSNEAAN